MELYQEVSVSLLKMCLGLFLLKATSFWCFVLCCFVSGIVRDCNLVEGPFSETFASH